jgi:hypothetical protein
MNAIMESHKPASILSFWLIYDSVNNQAYLSHPRLWEGSIMCNKNVFGSIQYSTIEKGEDMEFIDSLRRANYLHPVINACMYIYQFNGRNTWDAQHFYNMCSASQALPASISDLIKNIFSGRYSNKEASRLLLDSEVMKELDYWHWHRG